MRIFLVYPGHSFSTYDVARGYDAALRQLGHQVWAFNYHEPLAFYQCAIDYWRERNPDFAPDGNAHLLLASERAVIQAVDFVPDVVLIINGIAFHRRAYDLLDKLNLPLVLLLTESPYDDELFHAPMIEKGHIALAFTNDRASLDWLPGRVRYLPHSYDPAIHYPRPVNGQHQSDVFFHGTLFEDRRNLFAGLNTIEGINLRIGGPRPDQATDENQGQVIDNTELANYYCGTKVALNAHRPGVIARASGGHGNRRAFAYSLGPRAYEIAACGAFQLCDDSRPELWEVFDESVAVYENEEELVETAAYYLEHDSERQAMADAARECVRECTFLNRAREILIPAIEEVIYGGTI